MQEFVDRRQSIPLASDRIGQFPYGIVIRVNADGHIGPINQTILHHRVGEHPVPHQLVQTMTEWAWLILLSQRWKVE